MRTQGRHRPQRAHFLEKPGGEHRVEARSDALVHSHALFWTLGNTPFARDAARYDVLANWWAEVVKPTHTRLYIGVALYKVGEPSKNEPDWTVDGGVPELKKQLDLNESLPQIQGTILFRENNLNQPQTRQAVNYLRSRWGQPQS